MAYEAARSRESAKRKSDGVLAWIVHVAVVPISEWRGCHHENRTWPPAVGSGHHAYYKMRIDFQSNDRLSLVSISQVNDKPFS